MLKLDKGAKTPLYLQVKAGLLAQIHAGTYGEEDPLPTESALADSLDLSRLTVRRAIVELAQEGLVHRIPGRGTFIVTGAPRPSIRTLGFLIADDVPLDMAGPFFGNLLHGVQTACEPASLNLRRFPDDVETLDVQAALALWVLSEERLQALAATGMPTLAYECPPWQSGPAYDSITHANEEGAYDAVCELITLGHRDIACATQPTASGQERRRGYERALRDHGITPKSERIHVFPASGEAGYAFGRRLFADRRRAPTAVFCSDDTIAHGLSAAVQESGLRIPDFVSVVGFGNLGLFCAPALTTVRMDIEASGREAVRLLKERAANPQLPARHLVLPTELIRRASSGPPRPDNA